MSDLTLHQKQSIFFAKLALDWLPQSTLTEIDECGSLLDWGCGDGYGTRVLKERFPQVVVVGQDCNEQAILRAREMELESQSGVQFFVVPETPEDVVGSWDVIFTSNTLEHLQSPQDWMSIHLSHAKKLYIVLVPYQEGSDGKPLVPGHVYSFQEEDFPETRLDNWARVDMTILPPSDSWGGKQALVTYHRSKVYGR